MRYTLALPGIFLLFIACNEPVTEERNPETPIVDEQPGSEDEKTSGNQEPPTKPEPVDTAKAVKKSGPHANKVFRKVMVEKIRDRTYRATGEAQVFEASFSYVVEDGHNKLLEGHSMTDNGAPEWGKFDFTFSLPFEPSANTTPHLILLVYSAMDGSPTHELPIPLP